MDAKQLFSILQIHCDDVRRYRWLNTAEERPAFVCESGEILGIVATIVLKEPQHRVALAQAFNRARQGKMGQSAIVYFSTYIFAAGE